MAEKVSVVKCDSYDEGLVLEKAIIIRKSFIARFITSIKKQIKR